MPEDASEATERNVRNPDILAIILCRYFLEEATKLSCENLTAAGKQCREVCDLLTPAVESTISPKQIEYVLLYYSQRPDELLRDIDSTLETIKYMMHKALIGD